MKSSRVRTFICPTEDIISAFATSLVAMFTNIRVTSSHLLLQGLRVVSCILAVQVTNAAIHHDLLICQPALLLGVSGIFQKYAASQHA